MKIDTIKVLLPSAFSALLLGCGNGDTGLLGTGDGGTTPPPVNAAPQALDVSTYSALLDIPTVFLTGRYADVEGDAPDKPLYRWLRDGVAIPGETHASLGLTLADFTGASATSIQGCVTPRALTGALVGNEVCTAFVPQTQAPGSEAPSADISASSDQPFNPTRVTASYTYFSPTGTPEGSSRFVWLQRDTAGMIQVLKQCATGAACEMPVTSAMDGYELGAAVEPADSNGAYGNGDIDWLKLNFNTAPAFTSLKVYGGASGTQAKLFAVAQYEDADGDVQGISRYQWQLEGADIAGATNAVLDVKPNMVGKTLTVKATPVAISGITDGATVSADFNSQTPSFPSGVTPPSATVTISGVPALGNTLSASYSYAPGTGGDTSEGESVFAYYGQAYYSGMVHYQPCTSGAGVPCELTVAPALADSTIHACVIPEARNGSYGAMACDQVLAEKGTPPVVSVSSSGYAQAALRQDGSVVTWGEVSNGGDSSYVASQLDGTIPVISIATTTAAFAALRADGSVVTWGLSYYGGNSSTVATQLDGTIPVTSISGGDYAFAALRQNGSVVTWGYDVDNNAIASQLDGTIPVLSIEGERSFAALRRDGSVVAWGRAASGGDSSAVADQLDGSVPVRLIDGNGNAFAALRVDSSVVTWGQANYGGDSSAVSAELNDSTRPVISFQHTQGAFAALRQDGSVVTWGDPSFASDSSMVASQLDGSVPVVKLVSASHAISALRSDGSVVAWGLNNDASAVAHLLDGSVAVVEVAATYSGTTAALREDGSVVYWGRHGSGLVSEFNAGHRAVKLYPGNMTLNILAEDGSVMTIGDPASTDMSAVAGLLNGDNPVFTFNNQHSSNSGASIAIRKDGSVVTWGQSNAGGDSSAVVDEILTAKFVPYDTAVDTDRDGISNRDEVADCVVPYMTVGQQPCTIPGRPDSDNDGVWDGLEIRLGQNPLQSNTTVFNGADVTGDDGLDDINGDGFPDYVILPSAGLNVPQ
jgi:alpha-tubulin suppressor-like RCC1 family protein